MTDFIKQYPQYQEELEERIAIMIYDAGIPEGFAIQQAIRRLKVKYNLYKEGDLNYELFY
jgi:hypothetical protein